MVNWMERALGYNWRMISINDDWIERQVGGQTDEMHTGKNTCPGEWMVGWKDEWMDIWMSIGGGSMAG